MFAVVAAQGHQYIVQEGMELVLDSISGVEAGENVVFDQVLCTFDADGNSVSVGKPLVSGAKVTVKVLSHEKGKKTTVLKFQSKKRYQKKFGFRPLLTRVSVESIST